MPTVNHISYIQKIKSKGEIESHRKMIGERKKMRKRERKVERSTVK